MRSSCSRLPTPPRAACAALCAGREGARKDYSAHNCVSIVRMTGGPGEPHGCPYKRMDEASLRAALARAR